MNNMEPFIYPQRNDVLAFDLHKQYTLLDYDNLDRGSVSSTQIRTPLNFTSCSSPGKHLCLCGCGQETKIINRTRLERGRIKGEYSKFIYGHRMKGEWGSRIKRPPRPRCMCGCGEPVKWNPHTKRWHSFVGRHINRMFQRALPQPASVPLCECGCGKSVNYDRKKKKWRRYVSWHYLRTEEAKIATKEGVKARVKWWVEHPEAKERNRVRNKEYFDVPGNREKAGRRFKKYFREHPEVVERCRAQVKEKWLDPKYREMMSKKAFKMWGKLGFREKMVKMFSTLNLSPTKPQIALFNIIRPLDDTFILEGEEGWHPITVSQKPFQCRKPDIVSFEHRIIVEFDGRHWHEGREFEDKFRDIQLEAAGYRVLHFGYEDLKNTEAILDSIKKVV